MRCLSARLQYRPHMARDYHPGVPACAATSLRLFSSAKASRAGLGYEMSMNLLHRKRTLSDAEPLLTKLRACHHVSACFFGGHLMSGSTRPGKIGSEVRRRDSMAAVLRCGSKSLYANPLRIPNIGANCQSFFRGESAARPAASGFLDCRSFDRREKVRFPGARLDSHRFRYSPTSVNESSCSRDPAILFAKSSSSGIDSGCLINPL